MNKIKIKVLDALYKDAFLICTKWFTKSLANTQTIKKNIPNVHTASSACTALYKSPCKYRKDTLHQLKEHVVNKLFQKKYSNIKKWI